MIFILEKSTSRVVNTLPSDARCTLTKLGLRGDIKLDHVNCFTHSLIKLEEIPNHVRLYPECFAYDLQEERWSLIDQDEYDKRISEIRQNVLDSKIKELGAVGLRAQNSDIVFDSIKYNISSQTKNELFSILWGLKHNKETFAYIKKGPGAYIKHTYNSLSELLGKICSTSQRYISCEKQIDHELRSIKSIANLQEFSIDSAWRKCLKVE